MAARNRMRVPNLAASTDAPIPKPTNSQTPSVGDLKIAPGQDASGGFMFQRPPPGVTRPPTHFPSLDFLAPQARKSKEDRRHYPPTHRGFHSTPSSSSVSSIASSPSVK